MAYKGYKGKKRTSKTGQRMRGAIQGTPTFGPRAPAAPGFGPRRRTSAGIRAGIGLGRNR
jgi:hypothetical protein